MRETSKLDASRAYVRTTAPRCCSRSRSPPRAPSARSRGSPAAAAARRCPGSCSGRSIPGAVDRLAARLPQGSVLISATNGKTTTTAMVAEILGRGPARATTTRARTSLSRGRLHPARLPRRRARAVRGRRGGAPGGRAAGAAAGRCARQPLPRPARPLRRARARRRALARRRSRRCPRRTLVVNARRPAASATSRAAARGVVDLRRRRSRGTRAPALQHAADSKYCLRCGTPYDYAAAYVGHLGDYRCPTCGHARPPLDVAAREIELHGLDGSRVHARRRRRDARACGSRCRGSTTSTTRSPRRRSRPRSACRSTTIVAGLERFTAAFGRFERIAVGDRRLLMLLIKNPAGANEAVRTLLDGGRPRASPSSRSTTRSPTAATSRGSGTSTSSRCSTGSSASSSRGDRARRARAALRLRRPRRATGSRSSRRSRPPSTAGSS